MTALMLILFIIHKLIGISIIANLLSEYLIKKIYGR